MGGLHPPEALLAVGELPTPLELRAEEPHDGVDHDEREGPVLHHHAPQVVRQPLEVVGGEGAPVDQVRQDIVPLDVVLLSDCAEFLCAGGSRHGHCWTRLRYEYCTSHASASHATVSVSQVVATNGIEDLGPEWKVRSPERKAPAASMMQTLPCPPPTSLESCTRHKKKEP